MTTKTKRTTTGEGDDDDDVGAADDADRSPPPLRQRHRYRVTPLSKALESDGRQRWEEIERSGWYARDKNDPRKWTFSSRQANKEAFLIKRRRAVESAEVLVSKR